MDLPIIPTPVRRWECNHCDTTSVTREAQPHSEFHCCPGFGGLSMPMVEEGSGARTRVVERTDYIGGEDVTFANGRPVMAVITDRPDGSNDVAVYAPTAQAGTGA